MFKKTIASAFALILLAGSLSAQGAEDVEKDKAAIKAVITKAYVHGIHIDRDPALIRTGFHPDFNMLIHRGDQMSKLPIEDWILNIEAANKRNPNRPKQDIKHEFPMVDVSGNAAVARIELFRDGKHVYTDYMSLYKFEDGWKIVGKIFYAH